MPASFFIHVLKRNKQKRRKFIMGKSKQELLRLVDEFIKLNDSNVFSLCRECAEKIRHTDQYEVIKLYPDGMEPWDICGYCDTEVRGTTYRLVPKKSRISYNPRTRSYFYDISDD